MSREAPSQFSPAIEDKHQLLETFLKGQRPSSEYKIGLETEKIGVHRDTLEAVHFDGPLGIEKMLEEVAELDAWDKVYDEGRLISLTKGPKAVTLEPGGQLELSGEAHRSLVDVEKELFEHRDLLLKTSQAKKIAWLGLGIQPKTARFDIPWVPKSRYKIMRKYYEARSNLALDMMKLTASSQINLDYSDEEDARKKILVGSVLGVVASALTANSAFEKGEPNGFCSRRLQIWRGTDSDRCGIPSFFVDGSFTFEKYLEFVLDVPMYFVYRKGAYVDHTHMTFRDYLSLQDNPYQPNANDWESHLTTLFPDVRVKNHIELRTADATPPEMSIAITSFWVGLLYSPKVLDEAYALSKEFDLNSIEEAVVDVSRKGMQASMLKRSMVDLTKEVLGLAEKGLKDLNERPDYLNPFWDVLNCKKSLAEQSIERGAMNLSL